MTYALCSNAIILTSNRRYLKKLADCKQKTKRGANRPPERIIMKTIIHKEPKMFNGIKVKNAVSRWSDEEAELLVQNEGWRYCSKAVYKKVRDAKDPYDGLV